MLPRSDLVYKTSAWLLCQAGGKWRKPEVMLPILRSRTIRFRGGPGALVRFNFHVGIGESPRCCPVLRGLRDRCIAAMLATRKWLPRMDSRHQPPGSEPGALAVELQGKTIRQPELHRSLADTSGVRRYQRFGGIENGRAPRCCPECLADPNGADCCLPRAR